MMAVSSSTGYGNPDPYYPDAFFTQGKMAGVFPGIHNDKSPGVRPSWPVHTFSGHYYYLTP